MPSTPDHTRNKLTTLTALAGLLVFLLWQKNRNSPRGKLNREAKIFGEVHPRKFHVPNWKPTKSGPPFSSDPV